MIFARHNFDVSQRAYLKTYLTTGRCLIVVKIGQYRLVCYGFSMQMLAIGDLIGNLHHAQLITSARGAEVKI